MAKATKDFYISQLETSQRELLDLAQQCLDYFIKQGIYPEYFKLPRDVQHAIQHGRYVLDVYGNEHYTHD